MTKRPSKLSFNQTLKDAREHMNFSEKIFSYIIHNRLVDALSQFVARVAMRPIPVITGTATALLVGGITYTISLLMQYGWSGSELPLLFIAGWAIGLIYDYTMLLARGRK
jgi:hypothetical protein